MSGMRAVAHTLGTVVVLHFDVWMRVKRGEEVCRHEGDQQNPDGQISFCAEFHKCKDMLLRQILQAKAQNLELNIFKRKGRAVGSSS